MNYYFLYNRNNLYFYQSTGYSVALTTNIKDAMKFSKKENALKFKEYLSHEFDVDMTIGKKIKEPGFD